MRPRPEAADSRELSPRGYGQRLAEFLSSDAKVAPFVSYRPPDFESGAHHLTGLQALLFDEGWSRLGWPEQVGGLGGDPRFRAAAALRVRTRSTVERLAREETLGPEVSIDKLLLVDAETAIWDSIRQLYGPGFDLDPGLNWIREEFLFSRAAPIYGGSQEIQRSLVAQRVLGMPREP
jgi:alkylation response protein AidB-like acyl-CoA dehydrogenase